MGLGEQQIISSPNHLLSYLLLNRETASQVLVFIKNPDSTKKLAIGVSPSGNLLPCFLFDFSDHYLSLGREVV